MNPNDADAPLIERVKQGDVKAFEMLVVKYQRRIERLIGRMVRDVDLVPQRFATADDGFEHHLPAGARAINTARRDQEDLHAVRN